MSLTTFRKNGRPVPTPIWFAAVEECLYVRTAAHFGKLKRIARDASVLVAPCTESGEETGASLPAQARVLAADDPLVPVAEAALEAKYAPSRQAMTDLMKKSGWTGVYVEIRPLADEGRG